MALIDCPECGKSVSSAAPQCLTCGYPIATALQTAPRHSDTSYVAERARRLPHCSKCGTDSLRSLAIVHANGLSLSEGDIRGVGISLGGSIGLGAGRTTTATRTALSAIAQPPERRQLSKLAVVGGMFGAALVVGTIVDNGSPGTIVFGVVLLGILALNIRSMVKFNRNVFPRAYAQWERSYMCDRCGTVFVV